MESRLRKLEDRFRPPPAVQLRAMCELEAERSGLDVDHVHHVAEQLLARMRESGLPLAVLARDAGTDAETVMQGARELLAQWEAMA
jgi:hypothetical protein